MQIQLPDLFGEKRLNPMLRWFLFLTAIVLMVLGGALVTMIFISPAEAKKDDDDE